MTKPCSSATILGLSSFKFSQVIAVQVSTQQSLWNSWALHLPQNRAQAYNISGCFPPPKVRTASPHLFQTSHTEKMHCRDHTSHPQRPIFCTHNSCALYKSLKPNTTYRVINSHVCTLFKCSFNYKSSNTPSTVIYKTQFLFSLPELS